MKRSLIKSAITVLIILFPTKLPCLKGEDFENVTIPCRKERGNHDPEIAEIELTTSDINSFLFLKWMTPTFVQR